jgi:hypothetical protein
MKPYESWLFAMAAILAIAGVGFSVLKEVHLARACLGFAVIYVVLATALAVAALIRK